MLGVNWHILTDFNCFEKGEDNGHNLSTIPVSRVMLTQQVSQMLCLYIIMLCNNCICMRTGSVIMHKSMSPLTRMKRFCLDTLGIYKVQVIQTAITTALHIMHEIVTILGVLEVSSRGLVTTMCPVNPSV